MTRYEVIVQPEAEAGLREAFLYIHERSPQNAARWLQDLYSKIDSLERFPERCSLARERDYFNLEIRQMLHHSHRLLFTVDRHRQVVHVLHFRHAKQRTLGEHEPSGEELGSGE